MSTTDGIQVLNRALDFDLSELGVLRPSRVSCVFSFNLFTSTTIRHFTFYKIGNFLEIHLRCASSQEAPRIFLLHNPKSHQSLQNRYTPYPTTTSKEFSTASRSVKPGLIAAGIVSSWIWSATFLTFSTFTYILYLRHPRPHVVRRNGHLADPPLA